MFYKMMSLTTKPFGGYAYIYVYIYVYVFTWLWLSHGFSYFYGDIT